MIYHSKIMIAIIVSLSSLVDNFSRDPEAHLSLLMFVNQRELDGQTDSWITLLNGHVHVVTHGFSLFQWALSGCQISASVLFREMVGHVNTSQLNVYYRSQRS